MQKILKYFIENKIVVLLVLLIIIFMGLLSLQNLKQEIFPATDMETMIVTIKYPGASPVDVELNAIIPLEEKLQSIPGINDFTSLSIENGGTIYIYIDQDISNIQTVKDTIYREMGDKSLLPPEVEDISIMEVNPKRMVIQNIGVTFKQDTDLTEREFFSFVKDLDQNLKKIEGVGETRISGYGEREIKIYIDPDKLQAKYLSLNEIVKSIQTRNIRSTGGTIQSINKEKNIVTIGQFTDPLEVRDVIIRSNFEKRSIRIHDIGSVKDGFKKEDVLIRVNKDNGVTISIIKKENADIVKTTRNVAAYLKQISDRLPHGINLTVIEDRSLSIISLFNVVINNAIIGFVIVFIIMLLFMDLRASFWTAFGIPVTLFILFIFMNIADFSLNLISLGALITVLGMLVDHGIMISENIYSFKAQGLSSVDAAVKGVHSVLAPVIVTILTTIFAFIPLLFIRGTMGKFIFIYPIIITLALAGSFIDAVFFLPHHMAGGKSGKEEKKWFQKIKKGYQYILKYVLKFRYLVVLVFCGILLFSLLISQKTINDFILMWDNSADAFFINLEAEDGSPLRTTSELTRQIEDFVLQNIPEKERISIRTAIGHHTVKRTSSQGNHENWAQVAVYLVPKGERQRDVPTIIKDLKKKLKQQKPKGFNKVAFSQQVIGPAVGNAVDIKISAPDEATGELLRQKIEEYLKSIDGVMDITNDQKKGKEELLIQLDFDKLAQLDMTVAAVAQTVRTAYDGVIATSIQTLEQKLDFRVQLDEQFTLNNDTLLNLRIPNDKGRLIRLGDIADIKPDFGASVINHYNGERVITIIANVDKNLTTPTNVVQQVKTNFGDIGKKYPGTKLIFKGEAAETNESLKDFIFAFILAFILIYAVLIILFKSFEQPLLILLTIPFGIIGVLLAFTIHGMPLSFMALVGIIGLGGVVVNDSVVMVDFINKLINKNPQKHKSYIMDSIVEGSGNRLRPILLTTITTVGGLLPTVYGIGGEAASLVPVTMAMAYGLLFATLVTLFFVPSLYLITMDIRKSILKFLHIFKVRKST
ncbi:MAG: efflux RND transporter permease subunit [Spirochaetales bacterium]|nr:efflux RND transporter permease subunit [Spirochaetales bacterium]